MSALTATATAASLALGAALRPRAVALLLLSCAGAVLLVASGDVVTLVAGASLLCLPLAAYDLRARVSIAGVGGVVLVTVGAIGLAVANGATSLANGDAARTPLGLAGIALLVAGLALAGGLVPIDLGSSRANDAAREAHVAIITTLGAVGGLLRVGAPFTVTTAALVDWRSSIAVLSALTIVVSTLAALAQRSPRRILLYGWIAQAGYAAMTLTAGVAAGPPAAFVLVTLALGAIGTLALAAPIGTSTQLRDLRGLARRRPVFVVALAVLLLGLAGVPPTMGFVAKVYALEVAVSAQLAWLAIIAAIASVLSVVYYLRIVFACLGDGDASVPRRQTEAIGILAALLVLGIGIVPAPLLSAVQSVRF